MRKMFQTFMLRGIIPWIRNLLGKTDFNIVEDCKLVILVRTDLNLSKGKIATSCSHAAVECYRETIIRYPSLGNYWLSKGQKKVILKWDLGATELQRVAKAASKEKLVSVIIRDAGRTQVVPGTITAVGIGPANGKIISKILPVLKLL